MQSDIYYIIYVKEVCEYEFDGAEFRGGERVTLYATPHADLQQALTDYVENFDLDNVIETEDDFAGECLDSYIVSARFYVPSN